MKFCRNIALADKVFVRLDRASNYLQGTVQEYDEEFNEFLVKVEGAWRLHQNWWVPCDEIKLKNPLTP